MSNIIEPVGSANNPLYVQIKRELEDHPLRMILVSVIPVVIIMLMQNPALRQRLSMKACHYGKEVCHAGSDALIKSANNVSKMGDVFGTWYNKVRL